MLIFSPVSKFSICQYWDFLIISIGRVAGVLEGCANAPVYQASISISWTITDYVNSRDRWSKYTKSNRPRTFGPNNYCSMQIKKVTLAGAQRSSQQDVLQATHNLGPSSLLRRAVLLETTSMTANKAWRRLLKVYWLQVLSQRFQRAWLAASFEGIPTATSRSCNRYQSPFLSNPSVQEVRLIVYAKVLMPWQNPAAKQNLRLFQQKGTVLLNCGLWGFPDSFLRIHHMCDISNPIVLSKPTFLTFLNRPRAT